MTAAKRFLFLVHRWMGIGACLFFAMWFVSGVVMMYVGYPKLTTGERLAHLPPLVSAPGLLPPAAALAKAGIEGPLRDLRLAAARGGKAVYLVYVAPAAGTAMGGRGRGAAAGSGTAVVDAMTGNRLRPATRDDALATAAAWAGDIGGARSDVVAGSAKGTLAGTIVRAYGDVPAVGTATAAGNVPSGSSRRQGLTYVGEINEDAFSHSRALDAHRPLHVIDVDDAAETRLYVSSLTGEVIRDAPRTERLWNYAGAWIHWLYPFRGNAFDPWWSAIVNTLSVLGLLVALTGSVIGVMRWRFTRTYRSGSRSPYTGSMMRWHHLTGLLFAAVTITWIFSGWMSMNPWQMFTRSGPALKMEAMQGRRLQASMGMTSGALPVSSEGSGLRSASATGSGVQQAASWANIAPDADASVGAATIAELLSAAGDFVKELRWTRALGQDIVLARSTAGAPTVLNAHTAVPVDFDEAAITQAASRLMDFPIDRIDRLTAYDTYYYARDEHTMTGGGDKTLPMLRVRFADPSSTWVHIDPRTAAVLGQTDDARRVYRWLFAMLHSWDWLPLLDRRPLWDTVLVLLSLGGAALSVTGVVIGWRRLGRKLRVAGAT